MGTKKAEMTVDEVVATLKKTSLPTIVVEGKDDIIVYRVFEEKLAVLGVSVLPVGGREKVLEVFLRKSEFSTASRTVFIADKDVWSVAEIPSEYVDQSMLFTHGYSIENDIYIDGDLRNLLRGKEHCKYAQELHKFIEWYALALNRHLVDSSCPIALHPDHVLNPGTHQSLIALEHGESYPEELRQRISDDYASLLRGKSLLALLVRNTSYKGREPRHSHSALLETVAIRPGKLLNDLHERVEMCFRPPPAMPL